MGIQTPAWQAQKRNAVVICLVGLMVATLQAFWAKAGAAAIENDMNNSDRTHSCLVLRDVLRARLQVAMHGPVLGLNSLDRPTESARPRHPARAQASHSPTDTSW
jgi:hypothetical protein